ncbi:MAG: PIG-L family deacetylase [Candidatus Eisenbacteria bacterium]|nr:PIG-L family deacetylase [Candidatus Eisenbacteria bacterium]
MMLNRTCCPLSLGRWILAGLAVVVLQTPALAADVAPRPPLNAAEIDMALKRLSVVGTALYVAAHPDDENTAMLTWLENVKGVRAAYISMTRGDGGQNLIGNEKGDLLGLIRTQELLAARRIDGAEQFFTRAIDFGYSKTPEETLDFWGREIVLADLVRTIRLLRPDIVINRFPTTGEGGHGHHTASAILSVEAFEAAGDPGRFPEQVARYGTWTPKRAFFNWFTWTGPPDSATARELVQVDVGDYAPLLGKSSNELAADSRSMHKSQGFGSAERRGHQLNYFRVVAGDTTTTDPFEGIDLSWNRVAGGKRIGSMIESIRDDFDPRSPSASLPALASLYGAIASLPDAGGRTGNAETIARKLGDLREIIRSCAGLWLEAVSVEVAVSGGDSLHVTATAVNRSAGSIQFTRATLDLAGHPSVVRIESGRPLADNTPISLPMGLVIPNDIDWTATQPYWLRKPHERGSHVLDDTSILNHPDNDPVAVMHFEMVVSGQPMTWDVPVVNRAVDRVKGELYRPLAVVPPVTAHLDQQVYLFADRQPRPVTVTVTSRRTGNGTVQLEMPDGWSVNPASAPLRLTAAGPPVPVTFQVTPPVATSPATPPVMTARVDLDGTSYRQDQVTIEYDHLPRQTVFPGAEAKVVRLDLATRGQKIGYVMGPGDEIPPVLTQAGYRVDLLTDADLNAARLAAYDAVVIGIRAYNSRDGLKRRNGQILQYAEAGGTVIVQYNTADNTFHREFAPFPLKLGRDRVTVEEAPITLLEPENSLLTTPNRIAASDFDGWVQERGLYFASEWDPKFTPLLSSNDPGEPERKGGLLAARTGKGMFIYTGYAFFRQLPAGNPGAIRLFVNLVSAE